MWQIALLVSVLAAVAGILIYRTVQINQKIQPLGFVLVTSVLAAFF